VRRIKNHQILQPEACTISKRTASGRIQNNKHNKQDTQKQWSSKRTLPNNAMVFNLLEFNKWFKYYWWLQKKEPIWLGKQRGKITVPPVKVQWSEPTTPEGYNRMNLLDYPEIPPLNRNCHEDNIYQTNLAEYYCMGPRQTYLELYFRVYHSISNRIIRKIARRGLRDVNNDKYEEANIVEKITSNLPSGLLVDGDGMRKIANELVERRKTRRLDEEAQLQKEMELLELS
jgi:hypothetical protein